MMALGRGAATQEQPRGRRCAQVAALPCSQRCFPSPLVLRCRRVTVGLQHLWDHTNAPATSVCTEGHTGASRGEVPRHNPAGK